MPWTSPEHGRRMRINAARSSPGKAEQTKLGLPQCPSSTAAASLIWRSATTAVRSDRSCFASSPGWEAAAPPRKIRRLSLSASPNPIATTHLPFFITAPGETDVLFNVTLVFVVACIILTGVVFLTIHSLPERMAHKSKKILLDLIALLCLLALLTHEHLFWFAAIVLAFIDIPDF